MSSPPPVPDELLTKARARAAARQRRDWVEADRLRAEIEAAGWKIVDHGTDFALSPASPPDVVEAGVMRYGSSQAVPSRLDDEPIGLASVVLVAEDWVDDLARALTSLTEHGPDGLQVVVVANEPSPEQAPRLQALDAADPGSPGIETETIWTSARLGHATALNAGIRRAAASVVVLLDTSVELTGDAITPLVRALDDPSIALAGPFGIVSDDLRNFREAPPGDVDAIEGYCLAFRRDDYRERGPLDEHFRFYRNLDIWWSLVLRDAGIGQSARRALGLPDLPLTRYEHRSWTSLPADERDRLSKRNFYRILDRFRDRRDLLVSR
jgi:GT2 family glycosyltransferase